MCSRADDPTMHDKPEEDDAMPFEPPEERDLSEIAADEGLPVATLRAALRVSHPDASAFEVIGLAHRMNAGED